MHIHPGWNSKLFVTVTIVILLAPFAAAQKPDIAGTWKLNEAKSDRATGVPSDMVVRIRVEGPEAWFVTTACDQFSLCIVKFVLLNLLTAESVRSKIPLKGRGPMKRHETYRNRGTDAQSRCRRHLRGRWFRENDVFGYCCAQHDQSNAGHTYVRIYLRREWYDGPTFRTISASEASPQQSSTCPR